MTGSKFPTKDGIVYLHLFSGTHRIAYVNEGYFDSYGSPPHKMLSDFVIKNGKCIFPENEAIGKNGYCAVYCSYNFYLIKKTKKNVLIQLFYFYSIINKDNSKNKT